MQSVDTATQPTATPPGVTAHGFLKSGHPRILAGPTLAAPRSASASRGPIAAVACGDKTTKARPPGDLGHLACALLVSFGDVPGIDHVADARAVYDASADDYVRFVGTELTAATETTTDLALVEKFIELVVGKAGRRVADLGCGPGRVAALLARNGLVVTGVDVSFAMLSAARLAHPQIQLTAGQLDALPMADASLAGVVSWYSVIYTPPDRLREAFGEMHRVLAPGGYLLLAFQAGDGDPVHREDAHRTGLHLTSYRHDLDDVAVRLRRSGLRVRATALREPQLAHETTPPAFVIANNS